MNTQSTIDRLITDIRRHDAAYEVGAPVITDAEYDDLVQQLQALEAQHPALVRADSPTQSTKKVLPATGGQVKHLTPMISIDNAFDVSDMRAWLDRVTHAAGVLPELVAEPKFDGLAISLVYQGGRLISAATRGDYEMGEDVLRNTPFVLGIPQTIDHMDLLNVRGEVVILTDDFMALNRELEAAGKKTLATARNAAAGSLRLKEATRVAARRLTFYAYAITGETRPAGVTSQSEAMQWLLEHDFKVFRDARFGRVAPDEIELLFQRVSQDRYTLPFDMDGIVFKVNDLALSSSLGTTGRIPLGLMAYKFNQQDAATVVEAIDVQVGRSGVLTPVARLRPVLVGGVMVSNATLHNQDQIDLLDVRVGDTVLVRRNGDVIPGVVSVDLAHRPPQAVAWKMPEICPCCHQPVSRRDVFCYCTNPDCAEIQIQRIIYAASKPALDIDGVDQAFVRKVYAEGRLRTIADMLTLDLEWLKHVDGWGDASVQKVRDAIEAARHTTLQRTLIALGMEGAGINTAKNLANHFGSLEAIRAASMQQLMDIQDVGRITATSIVTWMSQNGELLEALQQALIIAPVEAKKASPVTGKTFVITGTLSRGRDEIAAWLESLGAKVSGSVSRKTDFLLCGREAGSKLDRANALGVRVVSLEEVEAWMA